MVRTPAPRAHAGTGASSDQTRRHNLSTLLTAVHQEGPQARSRLTASSGLNRSTVSALVGELESLGLVRETEPDPTNTVGRPSPTVQVSPAVVGIAINPEVDAVTIGVVGLNGKVHKRIRYETEHAPSVREAVNISAAVIEGLRGELESNHRVVGVGVAVPGLVRSSDGLVRWAPHLEWADEPVAAMLAEATGFPVAAGNDATLGAIAELTFGAGRGKTDLIYLNGGASGIGGGVIAGGIPLGGAGGYAGEFGHIRVDNTDATYDNSTSGTLESLVNRTALLEVLGLQSVDEDTLETALRASTDSRVTDLVRRQLEYLSTSLRNAVNVLNPQVIVLGGFLATIFSSEPEFLRERVRAQSLSVSFEGVEITTAQLGSHLLMIGAAELAFAPLLADPAGASGG